MRLGELLVLKWNKVDLERKTIKIERTQIGYTDYDINSKIYEESNIITTFKAFCNHVGVEYKFSHTCRRSYVTNCLDKGMKLALVSKNVGHKNKRPRLIV